MIGLYIFILNLSLFFFTPVYLLAQTDTLDTMYKEIVELSKEGKPEKLIPLFEKMLTVQPSNKKVLMDYMVVLSWAGRCNKSIDIYENLQGEIPVYVLSAAAKCYRNLKQFSQAVKLYKEILQKKPEQSDTLIGLAYSYADNLQFSEAFETLKPLVSSQPESLEPLLVKGYIYERMGKYIKAYQLYEDIIKRYPDNKRLWRAKVNVLSALGAHQVALEMAIRDIEQFDSNLITNLRINLAAEYIRWGQNIASSLKERWHDINKAMEILSAELSKNPDNLRARFDRMAGWLGRLETEKVIEEYEKLKALGTTLPLWVKEVAADAYSYQKQTNKAVKLYREILKHNPKSYSIRLKLFYAEITLNKLDKAEAIIKELVAEQKSPTVINRGIIEVNWKKVDVESEAIWLTAYQDRLAEAENDFRKLLDNAPVNSSIHSGLAHVYLWRGWPRKALKEFQWILNHDPNYTSVRIGYANTLMKLKEHKKAGVEVKLLTNRHPNDRYVKELDKIWRVHNQNEFRLDTYYKKEEKEGREWLTDLNLTSRPFLYDFRFRASFLRQKSTANDNHTYSRLGVGVIYDGRYNISISQEINFDMDSKDDYGSTTKVVYRPNDYWWFNGRYNTFSLDVPLRARVTGVTASSFDFGASYTPSDLRSMSIGLSSSRFSDGNKQSVYSFNYDYKLVPGSNYSNHLSFHISGSHNSLEDRAYFNPQNDLSYSITDVNEWVHYNLTDKRFKQSLSLSVGGYHQADFEPGITAQIKYLHYWELSSGKELIYSITLNRRLFDGEVEYEHRFNLRVIYHF